MEHSNENARNSTIEGFIKVLPHSVGSVSDYLASKCAQMSMILCAILKIPFSVFSCGDVDKLMIWHNFSHELAQYEQR